MAALKDWDYKSHGSDQRGSGNVSQQGHWSNLTGQSEERKMLL